MLARDSIEFAHASLGLVPEILDPVYMFVLFYKALRMINPVMFKFRDIEDIMGPIRVGIHDAIWNNPLLHNSYQRLSFRIRDHFSINSAPTLENPKNRHSPGCPSATLSLSPATEITFIHFDFPGKRHFILDRLRNDFS